MKEYHLASYFPIIYIFVEKGFILYDYSQNTILVLPD